MQHDAKHVKRATFLVAVVISALVLARR